MAIVGGLDIPDELIALFRELMRVSDTFKHGSVAKHGHLLSKQKKLDVSTRSLLPQISELWAGLTTEQKADWLTASTESGMRAWNLFVQDTSYRLKYGITGLATPSVYHQYKVGRLEINAPASSAKLAQYHPETYWKLKKVVGTKGQYEDVKITERLALPFVFGLSYRAGLTATTGTPIAKAYAIITSSYQGRDIETQAEFDIDLSTGWKRSTITVSEVLGIVRSYDIYLDFVDVRGYFEWDNVECTHNGTNYARDYRCSDVNNELTTYNYQIEKSWEELLLPTGTAFDSVYPQD